MAERPMSTPTDPQLATPIPPGSRGTIPDDPDEIRRDIERTRSDMDVTLDTLEDRVSPGRVAQRQGDKLKGRWQQVRSSVMGSAQDVKDKVTPDSDGSSSSDGPGAGEKVQQRTRGNPLAAGTIAFGVGALIGSLMPSSDAEQQAASRLRDEVEQPVREEAKRVAQQSKEDLQPEAEQAAQEVKGTATDAAQTTTQEGQERAQQVQQRASDASDRVQE